MSKRTALRTAPAFRRRPVLMATAAVVALMGLPNGPAWAQEPGVASQEGGAPTVAGGVARPRGEDVVRAPHASNGARLPRGENVVREPQNAALPHIGRNALPRDPNVVAGGATFAEDGSRLDINQSTDRVVIDWRSFDIGQDAEVNFFQPGTSSIAVNRISQGGVPSQIQGILRANGTVVILNPNGVIFSATSRVDVGGLVASTGRMDVNQFMAGSNRLDFTDATSGEIVMAGSINIADAGLAAFVAPHVRNDGVINARLGRVALAAGETFTLDLAGDRLIELGLGAHSPLVENFGSILVDGGRVRLSAVAAGAVVDQVINAGGLISVASAHAEGGTIVLEGANGGVTVSGELNASGATGGGDIAIGGATVETTAGAVLRADATATGDGGSIVSMADGRGTYAGTLSARGGAQGGDGGFIETSGKTISLDAGLRVDTTATDGANGSWSIDPEDLAIGAGEAAAVVANLATTNVVLQAQNSISINSLIDSSAQSNGNTLSLNDEGGVAGLTVNLNAAIRLGANQRLNGQATQINVRNGGVIQNAVDVALANAGIQIEAGDYVGGTIINKNGLTLTGSAGARIVLPTLAAGNELNGLTINADNVTIQNLEIVGPASQSWLTYGWNSPASGGTTRGIAVWNGADNFVIRNNNIHDLRTGIVVDGRNTGSITNNIIDNTKSAISVQYTDAGLLNAEGFAVSITGNSEGQYGNEWGFNFHLNGHQEAGGLVGNAVKIAATASTAVQQALLAVSAANNGMSAQDQGYNFSNRTSVNVGVGGNDANQGSALGQLATIQAGINAVVTGGKVNVGAGTFVQPTGSPAYLWVNKSVEIAGAGQGQTIIDARGASTYGIRVQADNVNLHGFTLWGVAAAGNTYGIKVEPLQTGPSNPNARLLNFALSNVTIQGSGKTELDLNGVIGATITNVTANGMAVGGSTITAGNGISITDSANVTLTGVTTLNNAWGGLALYQTNKTFNQQVNDISVDGSNTFNEANGIYLEDQSDGGAGSVVGGVGLDYGALSIAGYNYVVSDRSNLADIYTWFRRDEADAFNWLALTGKTAVGSIEGWTGTARDNHFIVGMVGGAAMSINAAVNTARAGGLIDIRAGQYAGGVVINTAGLTLNGAAGAIVNVVNGQDGITIDGGGDNVTIQGLEIRGPVDQSYTTYAWGSNITRGIAVRNGADNFTIRNNNIHDVRNGILIDGRNTGSVTDNIIDNTKSGISVQYTDAAGILIEDNAQGQYGNEWGLILHLNGWLNGAGAPTANPMGAAPTLAWQQALLDKAAANGGWTVFDQGYTSSNRTAVNVIAGGSATGQGSLLTGIGTIQGGINAVVTGGVVNVHNGTYVVAPGGYINVDKSLTLVGQSQAGVIIDARGASSYGLRVTADNNVSLSNFTLYGVTAAGGYGLKAEEVTGLTLANITSQGAFKAEFDLNGVIDATLTNLTADGASVAGGALTGGAGVAITDSQHITLTGVTTRNNAWGGLALYQSNRPTGYLTRMDDINVGLTNTFNEQNGVYAEDESALHDFGTLNIAGYDYVAGNQSNPADTYLWFQKTLAGAMGILDATGTAGVGYIEGWTGSGTNNVFNVGVTAGGTTMSINAATRPADQGAVINVGAGTYNETVQIAEGLTLAGAGIGQTSITGGILMSGTFSDLTLKGFTVTGNAGGGFVVQGGQVTNLTVDGVRIDAQSVAGRHGFGSGQYGGALLITNSQFANIDGWVVFDTRSGAGAGGGTQITSGVFSNNTIDNSHGNVAFRQQTGAFAYPNIVIANNTVTNVGSSNNAFGAVFKVFNANTVHFTGNSVSGVGTSGFNPAGEAAYGAVLMTRGVGQLNIVDNTFVDNNQVLAIEPGRGLSTNTFLAGNSFINNRYGIYMPGNALTGGTVTFGAGNSFVAGADTVQHIVWRGAAGLDLTNVLFDGKLTSDMSLAELFDLEDLISHATDVAGAGFATFKAGEIFVTTSSGSIQRGLDLAAAGNTVHVDQGAYVTPGTLVIGRSVNLIGAGSGLTVIDASHHNSYGIRVLADDVSLSGFSLLGSSAATTATYGIKVETTDPDPAARRRNFSITDVAISGTRKTGLDLNGVVGALIDGVTVNGAIAGNGISITDSADVTVRNTTTSGNAWGGLALYQTNAFHDQQVDNILIAASNVFGEAAGLYTQDSSATLNFGNLTIEGMGFTVRNDAFRPDGSQFTFYKASLQGALDYGVGLGAASSYVEGWSGSQGDDHFYVGGGDAGAGQQFLSIQTAFDKSSTGSVIDIFSGAYTGLATLTDQRDLRFGVVTLGGLNLTSGASGTVISGDITATGGLDFDGTIVLGGDTRLAAAGAIDIVGVDGSPGGQQALSVEGQGLVYVGQVGASVSLASLSVVGSDVTVRGANTTGDQSFAGDTVMLWGGFDAGGDFTVDGATTLGGDTVVDSDGDIRLGSIDGEHNLSLNAGGAVDLGAIGATEALNGLNVLGASINSHGASTVGYQSWNAATVGLSGAYAAGGDITVNGAATLGGSTSLTSDDYVSLGSVDGAHDLTIAAANFVILGPVGATTALSNLVVSADEIMAVGARTTGLQAFTGARVGLSGAFIAGGDFTVAGATELNGDVAIDADEVTLASVDGAHDLTVAANGAASLGAVGSTTALASLDVSGASIASHGAITSGDQSYDAATVGLSGAYAAGGDLVVDGATVLTADASLDAAGNVVLGTVDGAHSLSIGAGGSASLGAVGATTALVNLDVTAAVIASHGAVTTGDQSYDAAAVSLSGLYAAGDDFVVDGAATLNGATSVDADAVVMGTVNGAHHLSIAADGAVSLGALGATTALTGLDVSGASIVARGARTIGAQSWTAQQIRLAGGFATDNGDFSLIGLTALDGATTITTNGGDVVAGTINGTTAGGQSLSINAGAGTASVGSMGAGVRLGAVLVRSAGTVLNGSTYAGSSLAFLGSGAGSTVRLTQASTTFNTAPIGSPAGAIVVQPDLIGTVNGAQSVVFNAGSGLGANNGDITLGNLGSEALRLGAMTVSGDDFSAQTVKLAGNFTSVLSGDQVFSAHTLDTLANVNARVGGNDSGPVVAGGSVTVATIGTSTGSISAGGPVSVVAGGAVDHDIASTGSVAVASTGGSVTGDIQGGAVSVTAQGSVNTNVTATGTVAVTSTGGSVNGTIQGGAGVTIAAQGPITANVTTPGAVTVTSPQPVTVVVNAGSVVVNAPGGKVDGTFGSITTDPNGTINVNGQTVVGAGSTDARQILIDQFLAPAGGVVGASGQIRLPVNLAVALIAPAGAGQGNRRPIVVNSIDRVGELLRLGYTAIIIQLDSGEPYEQEIDLAAAAETESAG